MCVIFQPILRLFLVMISTEACRVSLGIVPSCTYKHRRKCNSPRGGYPTCLNHSIATVRTVPWMRVYFRDHQCASHFSLISWSQVRLDNTGVRPDIVPSHTYKHCALFKQPQERLSRVFKPLYRHRTDRTMDPRNL